MQSLKHAVKGSVAEPEPSGAATFRVEPEPIFGWSEPAKKEILVIVTKHALRAIYNGNCDPKKTCINNSLFKSSKRKMLLYGAGAAWSHFFCLETEPT